MINAKNMQHSFLDIKDYAIMKTTLFRQLM